MVKSCDGLDGGVLVCDGHCGGGSLPWDSWAGIFYVARELVTEHAVWRRVDVADREDRDLRKRPLGRRLDGNAGCSSHVVSTCNPRAYPSSLAGCLDLLAPLLFTINTLRRRHRTRQKRAEVKCACITAT